MPVWLHHDLHVLGGVASYKHPDRFDILDRLRRPNDPGHRRSCCFASGWETPFPASSSPLPRSIFAKKTNRSIASSTLASDGSFSIASKILSFVGSNRHFGWTMIATLLLRVKVLPVPPQQSGISLKHQQVLRVPLLSRFGEIERPGCQCSPIEQHHLIVRRRTSTSCDTTSKKPGLVTREASAPRAA